MNIKVWCRSFLSIYNLIPSVIKGIDSLILFKGVKSAATSYATANSTVKQAEGIINLSQKKINLLNLKVLTDETLLEMDENYSKVLILRYIDNISVKNITEVLGVSSRTFFRKVDKAFDEFQKVLKGKVMKNRTIYQAFSKETFFDDIFEKINSFNEKNKNQESLRQYAENICNFIVNKMSRSSF